MTRRHTSQANALRKAMWEGKDGRYRRYKYKLDHPEVCVCCQRRPSKRWHMELHHWWYLDAVDTGLEDDAQLSWLCAHNYGWLGKKLQKHHVIDAPRGCHRRVHKVHKHRYPRDARQADQADYRNLWKATRTVIRRGWWRRALRVRP